MNFCKILKYYTSALLYFGFMYSGLVLTIFPLDFLNKFRIFEKTTMGIIVYLTAGLHSAFDVLLSNGFGLKIYIYEDKYQNGKNFQEKSIVTIPNHLSEFDHMFVGSVYNHIFSNDFHHQVFSKGIIRYYPLLGWFLLANKCVFINYQTKDKDDNINYIRKRLREGHHKKNILIFIEGSRFSIERRDNLLKKAKDNLWNVPEFKNVLIPKTTGLNLIEKECDIDTEYYLTMRFENFKPGEKLYSITGALKMDLPKEIHIFIDRCRLNKTYHGDNFIKDLNQRIYSNFEKLDNRLDKTNEEWELLYNKKLVRPMKKDYVWFLVFTSMTFLSAYLTIKFPIFTIYSMGVIGYYILRGYLEFK